MTYDHIVLISIDTLRSDGIACNPIRLWPDEYGLSCQLRTDVLDEMAGEGAFFVNAITAAPYTSASHASLLTGLWPPSHGVYEFCGRTLSAETLFAEARRHGYSTVLKTDFPFMLGPHLGVCRDVDSYIVENDDAFVEAIAGTTRSCSLLHFGSVHLPYGFHNTTFGGQDYIRKVEDLEDEVRQAPADLPADRLSETYRTPEDLDLLLRYKRVVMTLYGERQYERLFRLYLEGIERFCRTRLEPVLDRVRAATAGTRRLFVVFGDHGEAYNDETYGHFNSVDEGVLRVPLLFWGDDVKAGLIRSRVRTIDLVPTLYELLNWNESGAHLDGKSLVPAVRDGAAMEPMRAHSQAFVAQADQARRAQQQILDEARPACARVDHVLYKEAVYDGPLKLTRRHYVPHSENREPIRCEPDLRLEQSDDALRLRRVYDDAAVQRLVAIMDRYGAAASHAALSNVPLELLRELQNHGYVLGSS